MSTSHCHELDEDDFVGHAVQSANDEKGKNPEQSAESGKLYVDSRSALVRFFWWNKMQDQWMNVVVVTGTRSNQYSTV